MDDARMQWIDEQVESPENPLTEGKLVAFCKNPGGVHVPDNMVASTQLPPTETVEPYIEIDGWGRCWCLYRTLDPLRPMRLWRPSDGYEVKMPSIERDHPMRWTGGWFLGFAAHRMLVAATYADEQGAEEHVVYVGDDQPRILTVPTDFGPLCHLSVTLDGRLLCAAARPLTDDKNGPQSVTVFLIDPESGARTVVWILPDCDRKPEMIAMSSGGYLGCLFWDGKNSLILRRRPDMPIEDHGKPFTYPGRAYLAGAEKGLHCYSQRSGWLWAPDGLASFYGSDDRDHRWLKDRYRRGLRSVDGSPAFIADTTRHQKMRWVARGKPAQAAFDTVTKLFKENDGWFYYGLSGRQLCKMKLC